MKSQSNTTDYMWYIDVDYNGEKYRGVYFTSYRPYRVYDQSKNSNSFQDDSGYSLSVIYWFKYEPIVWKIRTKNNGQALLCCELVIDSQNYNYTVETVNEMYGQNWEYSTIRTWLNDTFLNTSFSDLQKSFIIERTIKTGGFNGVSEITNDRVSLMTGISSSENGKKATDYAQCQGIHITDESSAEWWILSPSYTNSGKVGVITYTGTTSYGYVVETYNGIAPTIKINLE